MSKLAVASSHSLRAFVGVGLLAIGSMAMAAAPVISGTPKSSVKVGNWYNFKPTASDADGNALRFSIQNKPTWLNFNSTTGQLIAQPKTPGRWSNIIISVSDGTTSVSLPAFSILVYETTTNTAPTITGTPSSSATASVAYRFQPTAADANNDPLGFTIQNKPSWAAFNTSTGLLSGTPTAAGTHSSIVISVSDGKVTTSLPAFAINVAAANRAPTISGTATTSATPNVAYNFRPTAADADGDTLSFSIANKPSWATFSTSTGQLSGTPATANAGTYSNIVITVSDGRASTSLPAFGITVAQTSVGGASLSWSAPTQNTDGTSLTTLAGYRIYYGTSATALTQMVQLNSAGVSSYVLDNLSPATYYFAIRAYTSSGAESANSNVVQKAVQ